MFGLMLVLVFAGVFICSVPSLVSYAYTPPVEFTMIMFLFGVVLVLAGLTLVWIRLNRTGAMNILEPARPGFPLWIYIYKDGECRIVRGRRSGEGYIMSQELDADIPDLKTYSLADHKIRFVPEGCAHSVDLDMVEYAQILDRKHNFENLKKARLFAFKIKKRKEDEVDG